MTRRLKPFPNDRIKRLLITAWRRGSVSLDSVCPSCAERMDALDHGRCSHCGKGCGCSFNPTSSSDFCETHP